MSQDRNPVHTLILDSDCKQMEVDKVINQKCNGIPTSEHRGYAKILILINKPHASNHMVKWLHERKLYLSYEE